MQNFLERCLDEQDKKVRQAAKALNRHLTSPVLRQKVVDLLDQARACLPGNMQQAKKILADGFSKIQKLFEEAKDCAFKLLELFAERCGAAERGPWNVHDEFDAAAMRGRCTVGSGGRGHTVVPSSLR